MLVPNRHGDVLFLAIHALRETMRDTIFVLFHNLHLLGEDSNG